MRSSVVLLGAVMGLVGCSKPVGLGAKVTPLARIHVQVTGDLTSVTPAEVAAEAPHLRVALVWGMQWLPEPFCMLPPATPEIAAVTAAACPDNFGFVPSRVGADAPAQPDVPVTLELVTLPAADVMVGDVTARVAYASLYAYDDRNGNGILDLRRPPRRRFQGDTGTDTDTESEDGGAPGPRDLVYGASFISMTQPDRRVAFREGAFDASVAFYPRVGCDPPPPGFSLLSAGGFSPVTALVSLLQGQLPPQDPDTCATATLDDAVVIGVQAPGPLGQLACKPREIGGQTAYRAAPDKAPDLTGRPWACADFPRIPGDDAGVAGGQQLVVANDPSEACRYVTHYTLRGCDNDPSCALPVWDITATPPDWWPCSTSP